MYVTSSVLLYVRQFQQLRHFGQRQSDSVSSVSGLRLLGESSLNWQSHRFIRRPGQDLNCVPPNCGDDLFLLMSIFMPEESGVVYK